MKTRQKQNTRPESPGWWNLTLVYKCSACGYLYEPVDGVVRPSSCPRCNKKIIGISDHGGH